MLKIGLTGGIGSGKTTVAELFADLGVPIIDTDQLARLLVTPQSTAWETIATHFGQSIIDPTTHELHRRELRHIIFANPAEKKWLEELLHPLIRDQVNQLTAALKADYCILVIPLLLESEYDYDLDRILVVDSHPEQQVERIVERDQVNADNAKQIMAQQISREERLSQADDIIDNTDSNRANLKKQVDKLHQQYTTLARN